MNPNEREKERSEFWIVSELLCQNLLHEASVMIPATQSDPGKEREEIQLSIVAWALHIQLCSNLMAGTSLFAEGALRFRKCLASKLLLS